MRLKLSSAPLIPDDMKHFTARSETILLMCTYLYCMCSCLNVRPRQVVGRCVGRMRITKRRRDVI